MFTGEACSLRQQLHNLAVCFRSPTLLASITVAVCVLLHVNGLGALGDSLSLVGQMTTPLALLLTGSSLANYSPATMLDNWRAYVATVGRLLVAPLLGLVALRLLPIGHETVTILVLEAAMPVGSNGILYCLQYGKDTQPMAQCTFLTIIGALASIPLVTLLAAG